MSTPRVEGGLEHRAPGVDDEALRAGARANRHLVGSADAGGPAAACAETKRSSWMRAWATPRRVEARAHGGASSASGPQRKYSAGTRRDVEGVELARRARRRRAGRRRRSSRPGGCSRTWRTTKRPAGRVLRGEGLERVVEDDVLAAAVAVDEDDRASPARWRGACARWRRGA